MNHLVILDTSAGELEKILSGIKKMIVKEFDPSQSSAYDVRPGDSLYFLRDNGECTLRVKANVVQVLRIENGSAQDLPQTLKELQPKLQFTEDRYNYWLAKKPVMLVEFECALKISAIQIALDKIKDRSNWLAFDEFSKIT
jgi:hypothetical protein